MEDTNATPTPEDKERERFMEGLERMFKNLRTMEDRLEKKGRNKYQDSSYRRLASAFFKGVRYAREKGWIRSSSTSLN